MLLCIKASEEKKKKTESKNPKVVRANMAE